jgi:hypothetical protein
MAHEIAKLLLEHAQTFLERTEAVRTALSLGMPLAEIEEYLDWLDAVRGVPRDDVSEDSARDVPTAREAHFPATPELLADPPTSPAPGSAPNQGQASGRPERGPATEAGPRQPPQPPSHPPSAFPDAPGAT